MCGIFVAFGHGPKVHINDKLMTNAANMMNHRGTSTEIVSTSVISNTSKSTIYMHHRRLAINDVTDNGAQPFIHNGIYCVVNGEILNHRYLRSIAGPYSYHSTSDCEVIIPLYRKYGFRFVEKLQGMFAGVIYDSEKNRMVAFRDRYGIVSLYYGMTRSHNADAQNIIIIASEIKCLVGLVDKAHHVPPGKLLMSNGVTINYRDEKWMRSMPADSIDSALYDRSVGIMDVSYSEVDYAKEIRSNLNYRVKTDDLYALNGVSGVSMNLMKGLLIESVRLNVLESDVPIGFLLSGGLDSSLVMSIAKTHTDVPIHAFTIGMPGSPDVKAAKEVVAYLNQSGRKILHTIYCFTIEEAISSISDVVRAVETYDITTIRASIPMYLLMKRIKTYHPEIKVVLSGEGSDELFSGYLYNQFAPSSKDLHCEAVDKINKLYMYDNLRAHKCAIANTIEIRPPFLYSPLVNYVMNIHPVFRHPTTFGIEKYILRKAFEAGGYLDNRSLWRTKAQFSDAISADEDQAENLIDQIAKYANTQISDLDMLNRASRFEINPPMSKEQYVYRMYFEQHFGSALVDITETNNKSIACSTERAMKWMDLDPSSNINDPSGRSIARYTGVAPGISVTHVTF